MILYTLLSTHTKADMTNIILTSAIMYYIVYLLFIEFRSHWFPQLAWSEIYNYLIVSLVILLDLYMVSGGNITSLFSKGLTKSKPSKKKKVKFSNRDTVHNYPAPHTPHTSYPTYPSYPSYPSYPQYQSSPTDMYGGQADMPLIDNRAIAEELESNSSESSEESIAVSDSISYSSEEY